MQRRRGISRRLCHRDSFARCSEASAREDVFTRITRRESRSDQQARLWTREQNLPRIHEALLGLARGQHQFGLVRRRVDESMRLGERLSLLVNLIFEYYIVTEELEKKRTYL